MSWFTTALTSSLGKKLITAVTGLFLCSFLVVHCGINALIFLNDGGKTFNMAAEFMSTNFVIRTMEIILFLGIITHIAQALMLEYTNHKSRPIKYISKSGNANSKWYSRSMGLLGTLILIFLILHLKHFWIVSRFTDHISIGNQTLYDEMKEVFKNIWVVIVYVLAMISLSYHLLHGFQSAFQTLGLNHKKYTPAIKKFGVVFAIFIPLIFALMPIALYLEIIK